MYLNSPIVVVKFGQEPLGSHWGAIGEPLGSHWAVIGESLGSYWRVIGQSKIV
jgi:hypothetical protein